MLRRVTFEGERVPPRGTELVDATGKVVGDIRSAAISPKAGGVGIAMVRREIAAGARLTARSGESSVQVAVL
jgi:hypothetical protein